MPRLVLLGRVSEIILTGDIINASEALRIRLINRVVPRDQLVSTAEETATQIMARNELAVQYAKEAITRGLDMPLAQGLELEQHLVAILANV